MATVSSVELLSKTRMRGLGQRLAEAADDLRDRGGLVVAGHEHGDAQIRQRRASGRQARRIGHFGDEPVRWSSWHSFPCAPF